MGITNVNMAENESELRHRGIVNGDVKDTESEPVPRTPSPLTREVNLQRIRTEVQKLKSDIIEQLNSDLDELFENFLSEVEQIEAHGQHESWSNVAMRSKRLSNGVQEHLHQQHQQQQRKRQDGDTLPDKVYITRRSILTELFEINHIRTIYHIFAAVLILFSFNTFVYDIIDKGSLNLNFELILWAFGKFPHVMAMWLVMQIATFCIVYPLFHHWAKTRRPGSVSWYDYCWLTLFASYQIAFLFVPVKYLSDNALPVASTVIILAEQLRLLMKVHSFVRENISRVLSYKGDNDEEASPCPDFSKYLYFVFSPVLVYRDTYPRTLIIRWNYVVTNFAQVLACLFYIYYIFERFCVPVFRNFGNEQVTPKSLLLCVFGCMLPGTLVLFIGFFGILHSWLNAFAEMLRFGDRLFYKDWWNSTSFSNYYRSWNIVVHDWLYTYIYKDSVKFIGAKNRAASMALVFVISAIFHEYIISISFGFFYPILFFMFAGAGFGLIFLSRNSTSRSWNIVMWVALFMGTGLLMCLYSLEYYARQNCPANRENFVDYLIPRSWTCYFSGLKL